MSPPVLVVRSGTGRRQRHQQRDDPARRDLVAAPAGGVQPAGGRQLAQVVVDLAGRADAVQFGQFGGGAAAAGDLPEQPQPDRVPERGERLGRLLPVAVQQALGERPVLPLVLLAGRQPDGPGEQHPAVGRAQLGELFLEPLQGPEVALAEAGRGAPGVFQCREPAFQGGDALFQFHTANITEGRNHVQEREGGHRADTRKPPSGGPDGGRRRGTVPYASSAGIVASWVSRSSARVSVNSPWSSTVSPSTTPTRVAGRPRAPHMSVKRTSSERGTATIARPADSENRKVKASRPSGTIRRAPFPPSSADSTTAWISPPSDRSCAASIMPSREAEIRISASRRSRSRSTRGGRPPRWSWTTWDQAEP